MNDLDRLREFRYGSTVTRLEVQGALEERDKLIAALEREVDELRTRHCLDCAMAYTDCPRRIELLDGGGPMDLECCSEWTRREEG